MPRLPIDTRELLLRSAKEEFLAKGYEGASLRDICSGAGLTTGALYSQFGGKEEMFSALVDPMMEEYMGIYSEVMAKELENFSSEEDNEMAVITFAVSHRDEFRLLFDCSQGTKYEGFKERLINDLFYPGYQSVFDRYAGRPVDPALVKIILRMKFEQYMELIYGGYTMEKVSELMKQLTAFAEAGFDRLMRDINKDA